MTRNVIILLFFFILTNLSASNLAYEGFKVEAYLCSCISIIAIFITGTHVGQSRK